MGFCGPCKRFSKRTRLNALPFGLAVTKLSMSALSYLEVSRRALAFGISLWRQAQKSRFSFGRGQRGSSHVNALWIGAGRRNLSDRQILQYVG